MFFSNFSDGTSKSKEQSQTKKETLKSEDSSFDDVLQAISKLRSGKIIKEKILIAEQSKQTTVHIDVEELKEI
ncbi:18882_t:CDS:1, partial [Gigaspora margarita]